MSAWRGQGRWWLLAGLALAALAGEAGLAWRETALRATVMAVLAAPAAGAASTPGAPLAPSAPPVLRLAHALAWAAADDDRALALYHPLQQGSGTLAQAARYNAANLLLRQGLALRAGPQPGQAIALIELAKQHYRAVLREDPQDWAARYNLERAQRLLADPDEEEPEPGPGAQASERAATTMRAFSPGLP